MFSNKPDAAWAVANFLTSEEMQRYFAVRESRAPSRVALYDDAEVLRANPQLRDQRDAFWNARPRPTTPVYALVSNRLMRRAFTANSFCRGRLCPCAALPC